MTTAVLIPLRGSSSSKTRLAPLFTEDERMALVWAMFERLLGEIADISADITPVVITRDADAVRGHVSDRGICLLEQRADGLNAALREGTHWAHERGFSRMLMLPADLPIVSRCDVTSVLDAATNVIVADGDRSGTNALLLEFPRAHAFEWRMGTGSYAAHLAEARRLHIDMVSMSLAGVATDLDAPDDWGGLPGSIQRAYLEDMHRIAATALS